MKKRFFLLFALILILPSICEDSSKYSKEIKMRRTLIIAHRGASTLARENTIESFEKAIETGIDMIEFDVRRTKDHALIVYHDELMEGKPIKELTYDEISKMTIGQRFSIPTFSEVLRHTSGKIKLDVEIKEEGYEKESIELLLKYFKKDQFVVTSFYDSCIRKIKEDYPDIKTGLILGTSKPKNVILTRLSEVFPRRRWREAKADILVPHWRLLWFGFLGRAKRENRLVFVWTVNDQKMIWKLLHDDRIDGIITDKPDLAISLQEKMRSGMH
jgi:glycerophosphoryl diester phosphodiesterase